MQPGVNVKQVTLWRVIVLSVLTALALGNTVVMAAADGEQKASNWWEDDVWANPDRGFNWYPPDKPKAKPDPKKRQEQKRTDIRSMTDLEEIKKEVEALRAKAVLEPSEANVFAYMAAQEFVCRRRPCSPMSRAVWCGRTPRLTATFDNPSQLTLLPRNANERQRKAET